MQISASQHYNVKYKNGYLLKITFNSYWIIIGFKNEL